MAKPGRTRGCTALQTAIHPSARAWSNYAARFEVDYPESSSRVLALLGALLFIKMVLLIPHLVILLFLSILMTVAVYIGYWAVLITGRYPVGLYTFVSGIQRWNYRVGAWLAGLTDRYPPFSFS